jgi:hypothetical protein
MEPGTFFSCPRLVEIGFFEEPPAICGQSTQRMHSSSVTVSTIPLQIVLPCWRISTWRPVYRLIRDAPPISVFLASRRDDPSALVADFTRLARETFGPHGTLRTSR